MSSPPDDSLLYSGSDDNEEGKTDDAVDGAEYEGYAKVSILWKYCLS